MMANYLLDIVILLLAAVVAVPAFRAAGFGAVPGFLVAGMLVGPSGFSLIDNVTEIGQLAELGVILLLFVVGIELKPSAASARGGMVHTTTGLSPLPGGPGLTKTAMRAATAIIGRRASRKRFIAAQCGATAALTRRCR